MLNLRSTPECPIYRVDFGALVMNLSIVGEGEDTGLVPSGEALCRAGLVTVLPLAVDHLSAGVDLSGAVYTIKF